MLRQASTWSILLSKVGNARRLGNDIEAFFRYFVTDTLAGEGFFEYLREPRTYEQIVGKFGFDNDAYARCLLDVLISTNHPVIIRRGEHYQRVPGRNMPSLNEVADHSDKRVRRFSLMAQGMARNILPRLRNQQIEFTDSFQQNGRQLLTKFDMTLGSEIYTNLRNAAFAFLTGQDKESLRGKQLLEVGCGNGRETAEIWLRFGGDIHITAIDPVASLLNLARERFSSYLDDMSPGHPPLTIANRPVFCELSALKLPFEDHVFDAVFHAFVLHWISDPAQAVREIVRVLKPGGLVFGVQPVKPVAGPYFDLVIRTSDSYGFFWKDNLKEWYANASIDLEMTSPLAIFRGHKPNGQYAAHKKLFVGNA